MAKARTSARAGTTSVAVLALTISGIGWAPANAQHRVSGAWVAASSGFAAHVVGGPAAGVSVHDALARARKLLPADAAKRFAASAKIAGFDLSQHVIDPTAYRCGPTAVDDWMQAQYADWTQEDLAFVSELALDVIPVLYALTSDPAGATFGTQGQYTHAMTKTWKDLGRFWSVDQSAYSVVPMHGSILRDPSKTAPLYARVLGISVGDAQALADLVAQFVDRPAMRYGNHPMFSYGAFTTPAGSLLGVSYSARIVMGDGLLEAYADLGYGDLAPQAILAHEDGHAVQILTGMVSLADTSATPESARRIELMADAMSSYYLHHPRGASMQWKRVKQYLNVYYLSGDCNFDSTTHHGTPDQRMRAAQWAYEYSQGARPKGRIDTPTQFEAAYDGVLAGVILPDPA